MPDIIVSSLALRAWTTAEMMKESAGFVASLVFESDIYEASVGTLIQVVSGQDDEHASIMLVGHNPGMQDFIRFLTNAIEPMPTAAVAIIALDVESWAEITPGCGDLHALFRPKEVMKQD